MTTQMIMVAGLIATAAGGVFYAFVYPYLSGATRIEKRHAAIKQPVAKRAAVRATTDAAQRRRQVTDSLKELDARKGSKKKVSLETKITQAGLTLSRNGFFVASGVGAVLVAFLVFYMTQNLVIAAAGLFVGGLGLPQWVLKFLCKRRIKKFVNEFPNAVDVIVRGIKSGLPVADCIRVIATEAAEPVRGEFRRILETQSMGLSIADATQRMAERVPVVEANFFAIVILIQQTSGGSLADSLSNLSRVLRERKKMKGKISAMSMEAKASAAIIGAMPFTVAIMVYLSSPHYIELLWLTMTGKMAMAAAGLWMLIGISVMKKMISFEI